MHEISSSFVARWLAAAAIALTAAPALGADVLYQGTYRHFVRGYQQRPKVPPATTPFFDGVLKVTPARGITVFAGDANFMSSFMVTNPPTFAGILQQTSVISVVNPKMGIARPGIGPGPLSFAFPSPTGSPPVNTAGVTRRLGAISVVPGPNNFGGSLGFLLKIASDVVVFGGGGGNPNLACPSPFGGNQGEKYVVFTKKSCVGLTTGPLPAMTLPSVMVPRNVTVSGWPATTGTVFAFAPAPIATTTLTGMGTDQRNPAGTMGSLQLVAPSLFHVQSGPPTGPNGQNNGALFMDFRFTLLPEPTYNIALIAALIALGAVRIAQSRRPNVKSN